MCRRITSTEDTRALHGNHRRIVTALNPVLGYEKSTELAAEAYKSGKGILEIIRTKDPDRATDQGVDGSAKSQVGQEPLHQEIEANHAFTLSLHAVLHS